MGNVNESYHSLAKWLRVCLKLAGLLTGNILKVSIQSLAVNSWASCLSPGRPLKIGGGIFTLGRGGAGPPGPGAGNPAAATCMAATICTSRVAPTGGGPGGPGGLASPTGPSSPGGGGGGGGASPPGLPPLPLGGTGAAISNTKHSSRLNLTLLVDNWSIDTQLSTAYASIWVACVLLWDYGLQATMVTCYNDLG